MAARRAADGGDGAAGTGMGLGTRLGGPSAAAARLHRRPRPCRLRHGLGSARPPNRGRFRRCRCNCVRTYEDHVLGKIYADWSFSRASDAMRQPRYQGRDRRAGWRSSSISSASAPAFAGVEFSPGVIKTALETTPEELLNQGWESLRQDGSQPLLPDLYESLIAASRRTAEVLGPGRHL